MGAALRDFGDGLTKTTILVSSSLWCDEEMPVADYYRPDEIPLLPLERTAIDHCRGRVLDIGAGAGRFAMELQARDMDVLALDASPEAVEVMRARGVRNVQCGDVYQVRGERWDTLLLMMHGIGIVGTLKGLDRFLRHASGLLTATGQILCDSADLRTELGDEDLAAIKEQVDAGSYLGEVVFQLTYRGVTGADYQWLFVDSATLAEHARKAGFHFERLASGARGAYLARLSL